MHITIALAPRRAQALAAYANDVSNPDSARYQRYLTPTGFARRFAPTATQAAAVTAWLRSEGLNPGPRSANGLSIPVESTAGTIERAFALTLESVRLPGGQHATFNSAAPAVGARAAGEIQAVIGLDGLDHPVAQMPAGRGTRARPAATGQRRAATGGPQPCPAATSAAPSQSAFTSNQIATAYEFSGLYRRGDLGRGTTIALYELEPNDPSDIAAYQSCYDTHTSVSYVRVDGGAGTGPGAGEAALDVEQVIGLAPRARLLVYQGPNSNLDSPGSGPYDTYSAIVSQDRAAVVSTSWGVCEPQEGSADAAAENVLFEEAAVQGQTLLAAAGDSGSEACDAPPPGLPDPQLAVGDPAAQPFVTGVGGTSLSSLGPPPRESVWNNGGSVLGLLGLAPGAGGGGISSLWRMPAYQSRSPADLHVRQSYSSGSPCGGGSVDCREVPDVAADADPYTGYLIYFNGSGGAVGAPRGWQAMGGTSAGAPLWAALVALADASHGCAGTRLGFINPVLYRLAGPQQGRYFNDVTAGNNDYTGTSGGVYPAGAGYDLATGLGSPKGLALATGMCRQGLRLAAPRTEHSTVGRSVRLRLRIHDAPGAGLHLSAHGLPPGTRLRAVRPQIVGRPRHAGRYRVVLEARDSGGAIRTVRFTWFVSRRSRR